MTGKNIDWRSNFKKIYEMCQGELKKTTALGKKMYSASQTNSGLADAYQELGELVVKALQSGELQWDDPKVKDLVEKIESYKNELEKIEKDLHKIKKTK